MNENIKLSVVMELLNKKIAQINCLLAKNNTNDNAANTLNYLLNLKQQILSNNLNGINDFLEKYKENNL